MARRKVGQRKEVKVDFANYCYLFNGIAGIGKTTLAFEVGKKLYGRDGVLILTVGQEPEPDHLGDVLADRAKDWQELQDIVDDLVEYRDTDYKDLRIIAPDTVDEIFRLAEEEVVNTFNASVDANKRVKSIKQAYGGYQGGENKVVDLVTNTMFRLRDAGYCIFFIGHTKQKNKKDVMTDIEYEQLTSNLEAKYYNAIKDKVNIVACAYVERQMNDLETVKDAFSKKDKKVGRIESERRVIVFRDEEYAIDVKSHFEKIEPKIDFDTNIFIETIISAIRKQHERFHGESSDKDFESLKESQLNIKNEVVEDIGIDIGEEPATDGLEVDEVQNSKLIKEIKPKYKDASAEIQADVKKLLNQYGQGKLDPKMPTIAFVEILKLFT